MPGSGVTDASGCAGCGSIPGTGPSGRLDASMCACKSKAPRTPGVFGGDPMSPPDRPSTAFIPPPPPARQANGKQPPVSLVAPPARQSIPSDGGAGVFVPPPPPMKQGNGKVPAPPRIIDVPADQPVAMKTPQETAAPVPFLPTTPMIGLAQAPNPFAPYCGNGIDAASELCRAASDAGLSDYCRQQLLAFLKSGSSQTLGSWIAAQELCDQTALRRAVGIAEASMAAKTSAGLYRASGGVYSTHAFVVAGMPHGGTVYVDNRPVMGRWLDAGLTRWEVPLPDANPHQVGVRSASGDARSSSVLDGSTLVFDQMNPAPSMAPTSLTRDGFFSSKPAPQLDKPGFGNPFGVDGYAWQQDRVRKPSPFAYQGDGSTMDYRNPSGGMPNYYRASGDLAADIAGFGAGTAAQGSMTFTEAESMDILGGGGDGMTAAEKGRLTAAQTADAFARGRDNPPTNYAAIIGSIGQAVGGVFAGINQAVDQAEARRLRELEINYANNARGAQLALQTRQQELMGEIARLRATPAATDPTTASLIQRLEQQGAEYRTAIQRMESDQGMGTGTAVALGVGAVAVLGLGAYVLMGKGRRR